MIPPVEEILSTATSQIGNAYTWGGDSPSQGFDCSGLIEWACAQHGVAMPRTAATQAAFCAAQGTTMSVQQGIATRGALLFRLGAPTDHVVLSLGNGSTVEAMGHAYGVRNGAATGRSWTTAARIPSVDYTSAPVTPGLTPTAAVLTAASDGSTGLFNTLLDPHWWLRAALIVGGGAAFLAGLYVVTRDLGVDFPNIPHPF